MSAVDQKRSIAFHIRHRTHRRLCLIQHNGKTGILHIQDAATCGWRRAKNMIGKIELPLSEIAATEQGQHQHDQILILHCRTRAFFPKRKTGVESTRISRQSGKADLH
jgi:hypothetical protein